MSPKALTRRNALTSGAATGLLVLAAPVVAQRQGSPAFELPESGEQSIFYGGQPGFVRRLSPAERKQVLENDVATEQPMHRDLNLRAAPVAATARRILQGPDNDLLVLVLICPHLGCVVLRDAGDFANQGGFFCPCYGTHYDGLGRKRSGPSGRNLLSPELTFLAGNRAQALVPGAGSISR